MAQEEASEAPKRNDGSSSSRSLTPQNTAETAPSWTSLLQEAKQDGQRQSPLELMQPHMKEFSQQMSRYGHAVHQESWTKEMVLQTRAALRFATTCLSHEETRTALQNEAILTCEWHLSLSFALAQKNKSDNKCRVLMARLLSNLVTSNPDTATAVATAIPLSPSNDDVEQRIRATLTEDEVVTPTSYVYETSTVTWVDMMLACSSCRDGLAAIVASLYNCILSIPSSKLFLGEPFSTRVASDRLLVSTLLRQMLPASSVTASDAEGNDDDDPGDAATEWIVRTIEKLCCLGLLRALYTSAGGDCVTPELIVLLHCVARAVHEATASDGNKKKEKPLLGRDAGDSATVASHVALADRFCELNGALSVLEPTTETPAMSTEHSDTKTESNPQTVEKQVANMEIKEAHLSTVEEDAEWKSQGEETKSAAAKIASSSEPALIKEAWFLVLEILATSLGTDEHVSMMETRLAIGRETLLIQNVSIDLGAVVDSLSATNQGRNARELVVSDDEQRKITGLVQLLGNVCYRCRQNQDLVRQTIVPFPPPPPGTTVCDTCIERTALHVLLSCTSFSYGCFTLREWAIIALRNVLEGNEANQTLVEQLEAQQPMQSAELEGMGLRVDMDPDGKVRVVPTDEKDDSETK